MIGLAIALLDLPYGYYVLLRIAVFGCCVYFAIHEIRRRRSFWAFLLVTTAITYNPLVLFRLDRELWSVINLATIWFFAAHMWSCRPSLDSGKHTMQ